MPKFALLPIYFLLQCTLLSQAQITRQAPWQQKVNYKIEVTLDDQNHILRGFETMEYINNSPNEIAEIYIHLWPNAYKNDKTAFAKQQLENGETNFYFSKDPERGYIDSLDFFINDKSTPWSFDPQNIDIAKLILNKPLKTGESCVISTPFLVKIPIVFSRLGHDGQTYNITQWYPKPAVYDANGWNAMPYLNQGEFYSEFGDFDVKITLPKNYIIAATGVLQNESEIKFRQEKGRNTGVIENTFCKTPFKTVQFKQSNIHDFAWFASKNFGILSSQITIDGKQIETTVYSLKEKELIQENIDAIKIALRYYSENAGNYPYSSASVVKSALKAGGGMEYPMITVCDFLSKEVIIHEVGHNWFYGILGSNERRYPWMDESINSYFESQAMKPTVEAKAAIEKKQNFINNINDYATELLMINSMRKNIDQAVGLTSADYTNTNYGTMVYGKGALIFKHLEGYLGKDTFKKCFNTYFETWKYKHPLPGDIQKVFEDVSGKNLNWFFNSLINTNTKIDIKFKSVRTDDSGNTIIKLKKIAINELPVPIVAYSGSTKLSTHWIINPSEYVQVLQVFFPAASESKSVYTLNASTTIKAGDNSNKITHFVIDPDRIIQETNRKNNQYRTFGLFKHYANPGLKFYSNPGLKFITRPDIGINRDIYIAPLPAYNIHNGFMLGAAFHNWSIPERKFEYIIAPLWGFKTQTLNGYANFNYKISPKKVFQSVDIGLNNASFAFIPFSETFTYYRTKGFVHFVLKPKNLRLTTSDKITLEYTNVAARWLEKYSTTADSVLNKNPESTKPIDYRFGRVTYIHENKRVIDPYSFTLGFEMGGYNKFHSSQYYKPYAEFNFFKTYHKVKKGFALRIFAASFYEETGNKDNGLFMYRLGGKNGRYDYGMEQALIGRGAETGLWGSHVTATDDNMKIKGDLGNFSPGLLVANLSSTLPGKIPIRPYVDFCINISDNSPSPFKYSGGLAFDIIPKIFVIYFPLTQSQSINDIQKLQNFETFGQKICFTIKLNNLEPHKFFKTIKLF